MKAFDAAVEYPRKRASIACNFCRHRVQDVPAEILHRLNNLEALLEQQKDAIAQLTAQVASSPTSTQYSNPSCSPQPRYWDPSENHRSPIGFPPQQSRAYEVPFAIPLGHHTPTGSFFALDRIKNLIGEYPHDFFFRLEVKRPFDDFKGLGTPQSFDQIEPYRLQPHVIHPLVVQFLEHVHPFFPIIEETSVHALFDTFPASPKANVRTSLCLIILALGKVSLNSTTIFDIEAERGHSGVEYFASAWVNLSQGPQPDFSVDHMLPVALFYGSLYLRYIGRPLQAWQLIKRASDSVQFMITQLQATKTQEQRDILLRTAWGCYILECDDLAEFHHLSRSGIEIVVEQLGFPGFSISNNGSKSREVFLAMCSIRTILNRVQESSHSIPTQHANDATTSPQRHSIGSLEKICGEFDRQLETWFNYLPKAIKPNLDVAIAPDDPYDSYIRARYFATEHIICRPSLFLAAQSTTALPVYIFENCQKCVHSCREFIMATTYLLQKRTHSNWPRMQALLAAVFTLSIAKTTPSLEALVHDFDEIAKEAIQSIEPWARHFETADTIMGMMKTIRQKLRVSIQTI
ncbi:unnamed protein product [Penicillium salamii]|uniref:Transcription factor domain-containing protein n=1 Tax=Penicillium salamii TaxID=1612424 RepID=A0A9W4IVW9_9EURO|nr:unnamed protein product [Penicillium salamii]CAG8048312.1 unnamed protein product [Penicillium salamii]CAG8334952.1 unnamed protein product [Penicillium salamii]CAG8349648.1 unnamed protein product [Penicillium salamii]CAG8349699.1 unnamed protein product [Penicillium salamii]